MYFRFPKLLITACALLAACSTDDEVVEFELEEAGPPPVERRAGSVLVEYNPAKSNGVSVHAQFLDVRGVSLDAAFDALDVWTPDPELDIDACSVRPSPSSGEESESVRLHMLDVGAIAVSALDHSIRLDGRRVPDLRSFSGVVYGNEEGFDFDEAFLPYEASASYHIVAAGGVEAGGFHVTLQAPSVPEIQAIGGRYAVDNEPIDLRGGDLELQWSAGEPSAALYLDLAAPGLPRVQCRVEDDGDFVVPSAIIGQVSNPDGLLHVTLRRVDQMSLGIAGVDDSSFVFATADEANVRP